MEISLFDYPLPKKHIAQEPAVRRDASRLMVVDRKTRSITHTRFAEIGRFLPANVRFFRNDVAVLKARLFGQRPTGGKVECLFLQPAEDAVTWWCLLRPGKKAARTGFGIEGEYHAEILETGDDGNYRVRFRLEHDESVNDLIERLGTLPLPPYIIREANDPRREEDDIRYQTVYADHGKREAAAAPTAGLHFTKKLIERLEASGATFYDLTLRVGLDTFNPIQTDRVEDHKIHREWYEIPASVVECLKRSNPSPRVAVGTTSIRSIEDAMRRIGKDPRACVMPDGSIQAEASIFIYPPFRFQAVDHLLTNFHLPKSSLLCLVSAFLTPGNKEGIVWLKELYAEAIDLDYRFYSYGDAMLIL